MAGPTGLPWYVRNEILHDVFGHGRIAMKVLDHHVDSYVRLVRFPAVVIGYHGQGSVGHFGFASAACFTEICHTDDVKTRVMISNRLGAGAEGRSFHVDIGTTIVRRCLAGTGTLQHQLAQFFANGIRKGDVAHNPTSEESVFG